MAESTDLLNIHKDETAADFAGRLGGMFSDSLIILSLSVGSKTGLIDKLLSYDEPKTCWEIAEDSGLKERYVQEWLGVMTTGGILDLHKDSNGKKFFLPPSRRHILGNKGGGMAIFSWCLPILAQVHGELAECFKKDGPSGIPYESYKGFHEWRYLRMQTKYTAKSIIGVFEKVPGQMEALEKGITMCDMGCSSGYIAILIAERFPNTQVYGVDIGVNAIEIAKKTASEKSLTNCHFHVADICNMPADWNEKFDYITMFDVLHDIPYVSKGLLEMQRTLKKGAYMSVLDINAHTKLEDNMDNPSAPLIYGLSLFNCVPTSLYCKDGDGMGAAWGWEKAVGMIKAAGFDDVEVVQEMDMTVHISGRK